METKQANRSARIAGLLYLGVVVTGIFSLMFVPSKLIDWNDASVTFANIAQHETLFRFWIVGGLACYLFFLFLPLALYKLLRSVDENYAKVMVLLAVISVPMYFINAQNQFTALALLRDPNIGWSAEQVKQQVLYYLIQYDNGLRVIHIFSGLWLFPFGYLVYRSGFLPKILGILLMAGCFGYLINFTGNTLIPNYPELGIGRYIRLPASIGEIGICLWMVLVGARKRKKFN